MVVAECIAVASQTGGGDFGDQLIGDPANVLCAAAGELGRNGVRSQQRGDNAHRAFRIETGQHTQHAQLRRTLEAVAGFGFDGGGTGAKHPVAVAPGRVEQILFSGCARERYRA